MYILNASDALDKCHSKRCVLSHMHIHVYIASYKITCNVPSSIYKPCMNPHNSLSHLPHLAVWCFLAFIYHKHQFSQLPVWTDWSSFSQAVFISKLLNNSSTVKLCAKSVTFSLKTLKKIKIQTYTPRTTKCCGRWLHWNAIGSTYCIW